MSVNPEQILAVLSEVIDPNTQKKLALTAKSCDIRLEGMDATITLPLGYPSHNGQPELQKRIETALATIGARVKALNFTVKIETHAVQPGLKPLPNVRNIIAVASGKGGVGKSTTSVNIALALASQGARVGLLDADIYGPSVPIMLGLSGKPKSLDGKSMEPLVGHGLQANSIGFLIEEDSPAIWRGPMVTQALMQLLSQTNWNDLDYLIVDMPPGTGDIALTMAQKVPLTGAIIVTTPQDLALADARRGLRMFQKVNVPVLGVVENMSVHVCSQCGHAEPIFGQNGGRDMANEFHLPWLGALPLQLSIRTQTDSGTPSVVAEPGGEPAKAYHAIAAALAANVAALPRDESAKMPGVVARKT
ncbi:iron-sulfur cluster carrier protein ApbC [Alcaligenaceae bacterium]|nr:iron-sulfur cluster carrier protein ApbC [Alcaligenaceae bacterium]